MHVSALLLRRPSSWRLPCTGISAASQPTLPFDDDDDLDMLIVHVSAGQLSLTASGSPAAAAGGAACLADSLNGDTEGKEHHHAAIAWLDAVVKGVNLLPGAKDSLLLVTLLTAVRPYHCCTLGPARQGLWQCHCQRIVFWDGAVWQLFGKATRWQPNTCCGRRGRTSAPVLQVRFALACPGTAMCRALGRATALPGARKWRWMHMPPPCLRSA